VAEYIHSILKQGGGQGSLPAPGRIALNILVAIRLRRSLCECSLPDLPFPHRRPQGHCDKDRRSARIAERMVSGSAGGGGRGGVVADVAAVAADKAATVTLANGTKLEGKLVREGRFHRHPDTGGWNPEIDCT